ncbi:type II secretion system protein C (GspC) [Paucimonas lemoignei]|uniref:Type II secretion system protein C (GspC) n=1 Tax=Paucimonas lemoignei TaxID=29443 RepID=A0A4R3HY50_PAULE|nr:type II secretion system protein N [Paucimonas lemoignei]TCS37784.1 type II secretion system protein C (GspC) [Paucimonas lemoignei]
MKQLPLVASFILFIALCASVAYWGLQLFKPAERPVAPPPATAQAEVRVDAAASLFGGRPAAVAVASNYELKGVLMSGTARESAVILSADGKPAVAIPVGKEIMPGVVLKEVHPMYVVLTENGVPKRVELPESARGQSDMLITAPVPTSPGPSPAQPTELGNQSPQPGAITSPTSALKPIPGYAGAPPSMQSGQAAPGTPPSPTPPSDMGGPGGQVRAPSR